MTTATRSKSNPIAKAQQAIAATMTPAADDLAGRISYEREFHRYATGKRKSNPPVMQHAISAADAKAIRNRVRAEVGPRKRKTAKTRTMSKITPLSDAFTLNASERAIMHTALRILVKQRAGELAEAKAEYAHAFELCRRVARASVAK